MRTALFPTLLLWPLGGALGGTLPLAEGGASTVVLGAAGRFPLWAFATYLAVAATSLWWSLLGIATWIRPEWVRTLFRPFADRFLGRHGMLLFLTSLVIFLAAAAVGGLTLFG